MGKMLNIRGCWLVNVPLQRYGYSFGVYVDYDSNETDVIDMCRQNDMFQDADDAMIAYAVQMDEHDYEFWKDDIEILAMSM